MYGMLAESFIGGADESLTSSKPKGSCILAGMFLDLMAGVRSHFSC